MIFEANASTQKILSKPTLPDIHYLAIDNPGRLRPDAVSLDSSFLPSCIPSCNCVFLELYVAYCPSHHVVNRLIADS